MSTRTLAFALVIAGMTAACNDNDHPGNDREAALDPPEPPAEMASATAALEGLSTKIVYPQMMTEPDTRRVTDADGRCIFRYTRVGFPVFAYNASDGFLKLNGKLVPLPASGAGMYADGPVQVTVRPLEEREGDEAYEAEMVFRLADAPNELGFHGYAQCGAAAAAG